jgi:hypothetical protein
MRANHASILKPLEHKAVTPRISAHWIRPQIIE